LGILVVAGRVCAQPAGAGIDTAVLQQMEAEITNGVYPNIHSVLIARHERLVYEHYWPGKDEILGKNMGIRVHAVDSLHDVRSISKSFVGACIGIAIAQGKIKSVDAPVLSFFPEYAKYDTGMKKTLTIRHLLTMSSGMDWDESLPYYDLRNGETAMDMSPDPIGYVLSRPMIYLPGTVWNYNSGTTEVLGAIIKKVSGKPVDEFAGEYLFTPLGITQWEWVRNPRFGTPYAASGLRLRPIDLLKFGLLYCNEGRWKGRQIVPAAWVDSSEAEHIQRRGNTGTGGYGYQLWLFPETPKDGQLQVVAGVGNGDQRVFIDKKHALVVVVTAGNYNIWTIKKNANALLSDYIYTALLPKFR
jgi:CubicO group peptidase (beta-lactamase class C family)